MKYLKTFESFTSKETLNEGKAEKIIEAIERKLVKFNPMEIAEIESIIANYDRSQWIEEMMKMEVFTGIDKDAIDTIIDTVMFGQNKPENIELTFKRVDPDTGNFIYKGSDGNVYVSVDGVIHDVTDEGEPLGTVYNITIKKGEPIYNKADRFGNDPGSKKQV